MKVCIDAGHGGKDGGAQGATVSEKWIALDVANRVAQKLQNSGMNVVMTRDSDYFIELSERANIANQTGADMFVSIRRRNSSCSARVIGVSIPTSPLYSLQSSVLASTHPHPLAAFSAKIPYHP